MHKYIETYIYPLFEMRDTRNANTCVIYIHKYLHTYKQTNIPNKI